MKKLALICGLMVALAICGCTGPNGAATPTPGPAPLTTPEPLPTPEPVPTLEPLPTLPPSPTVKPVPPSPDDPIIGTWIWQGVNSNTVTIYAFDADGMFQRRDEDRNMTVYTGVWERTGTDTYELIYNTPIPGVSTETITYHPSVGQMDRNQTYYTRA